MVQEGRDPDAEEEVNFKSCFYCSMCGFINFLFRNTPLKATAMVPTLTGFLIQIRFTARGLRLMRKMEAEMKAAAETEELK